MNINKIVALVPLKAHSERVPKKNFKKLGHKPLFRWIIDTLLSLSIIDQVIINTDARELLTLHGLPENERILIRDRAPDLCGDMVSMNKVLADDVGAIKADMYLMTHVTNPFLSSHTVKSAIDSFSSALSSNDADSLMSVNKHQARFYWPDSRPINHDPDNLIRTQDLEPLYEENSVLYLFTPDSFSPKQTRIGERPLMFPTPLLESVDIDTTEDWTLAEALART